jgi:hypothetical protein
MFDDAETAVRNFAASIASAYRLSTYKITIPDLNEELPELDRLLQLKHRLRKLWQETRDPACKTATNWLTKTIRMTRKKAIERWDIRVGNCEVTPQAIWSIARALLNRDAPKAPTAVHGYSVRVKKPTRLRIVWKISSHIMICVTNAMKGGWKIRSKIY